MANEADDLCARWVALPDVEIDCESISSLLAPIQDDFWVAVACLDRLLDIAEVQRTLLEEGIKRTERTAEKLRDVFTHSNKSTVHSNEIDALVSHFQDEPNDASLCHVRAALLGRLDRLNTYVELCQAINTRRIADETVDIEWEDDPWEEAEVEKGTDKGEEDSPPPFSLSEFLVRDMYDLASHAASVSSFVTIQTLLMRHGKELWPQRLNILNGIPEHIDPLDYLHLLPTVDSSLQHEHSYTSEPWRTERDISETARELVFPHLSGVRVFGVDRDIHTVKRPLSTDQPLQADDISKWYSSRVDRILESTGMTDIALTLVQHGASQGLQGLDELGEELSLMSRLTYRSMATDAGDDITLSKWRAMEPDDIVQAYLRYSIPESIVSDIQTLVLPYLYVMEARLERTGHPDPSFLVRHLRNYILSAPLDIAASIFEASKPTLPHARRLLRDDEDMVRLALACLYGSDSLNEWPTMSRIFECLPVWDVSEDSDLADEGDATIASLGSYVIPTTTRPQCTPHDLLVFFQPLPATSLSRILDILDVHLESGEILSRWNVATPLRWFLQSMHDSNQQRSRATRMSRRHGGTEDHLDSHEEWGWLLDDMLKLTEVNDAGVPSGFGQLSRQETLRIFFSGLLSTGKFTVAKSLLGTKMTQLALDEHTIVDICLTASREFYDNASSSNYHFGDMKLAYDCLSVPPQTAPVIQEKTFIEATSRIASFNVMSRPGIPISPLEIRLTKDRLSLISRVLSSTSNAYKYPEVILDLANKLGLSSDPVAKVRVLAMIGDTALQTEDFEHAYETNELMIEALLDLDDAGMPMDELKVAREVCWVACFQLGRQPEFSDAPKKLALLARALEFCPPERLTDILSAWRRLEADVLDERGEWLATRRRRARSGGAKRHKTDASFPGPIPTLAARFKGLSMSIPSSPDTTTLANTFSRVAANFPFSSRMGGHGHDTIGGATHPGSPSSFTSSDSEHVSDRGAWGKLDHEEVQAQASRALQKGIGWLIGADDD